MTNIKNTIFASILFCISTTLFAQNGINSPYSRYGFGILADRSMGFNKGMGGVAMGFRDGQIINVANPASYSAVDSLTALFDLGLSLYNANFKMGNLQSNVKNSSFDYFAFHFRAMKGLGVAVGILPYSNIKYDFSSNGKNIEHTENQKSESFSGDGGLHQVFIGAGIQLFKPLSIGVNFSYLYGSYEHKITNLNSISTASYVTHKYSADISTYMVDLGLQYTIDINKKDKITLGATYSLGHDLKDFAIRSNSSLNSNSTIETESKDTINNAFQLPHTFSAGVAYSHGTKWNVGADLEIQKWSETKFPLNTTDGKYRSLKGLLNDKVRVSVGGCYTPSSTSSNYFNRITYKVGGYYSKSYANADLTNSLSDKPNEFGLTAGVTLPISSRHLWHNSPKINISFQWVHANIPYISNSIERKLTENYLKLCVGLTFSERWFYKWKVQ